MFCYDATKLAIDVGELGKNACHDGPLVLEKNVYTYI